MKWLNSFSKFDLVNEASKNDPIPEFSGVEDKLGIILLGTPGSGKSTFARNQIFTKVKNIKNFSTDDVSLRFTGDPKKFHKGSTDLNLRYLSNYIETGQNFIYDTTGSNAEGVYRVFRKAKKFRYRVIFVLMLIDLETSKRQNLIRGQMGGHMADEDYIDFVYARQYHTTKDYLNILKPDAFYVVLNKSGKYKYFKFQNGELLKRKVDKYVKFIKESVGDENSELVDFIVENMLEFIDVGENVVFKSSSGDMKYQDYLEQNSNYRNFKPVITSRGLTTSKFSIVYHPKNNSFHHLEQKIFDMKSVVGRLQEIGWELSDFRIGSNKSNRGTPVKIPWISFEFTKPDKKIDLDEIELPDEDKLREKLESFGIGVESLRIGDHETELDFYSNSYDGELYSEDFYDEKFEKICDIFGFQSFDLEYRKARVTFEH